MVYGMHTMLLFHAFGWWTSCVGLKNGKRGGRAVHQKRTRLIYDNPFYLFFLRRRLLLSGRPHSICTRSHL